MVPLWQLLTHRCDLRLVDALAQGILNLEYHLVAERLGGMPGYVGRCAEPLQLPGKCGRNQPAAAPEPGRNR